MCQSVLESKTNYSPYLNCDHFYLKKQRHIWLSICEKIRFFLEERDGNMWLKGIPDVISNLKCTDISLKTKKWYFTIVVKCSYGKEQLFCWRKIITPRIHKTKLKFWSQLVQSPSSWCWPPELMDWTENKDLYNSAAAFVVTSVYKLSANDGFI